MKTILLVEDEIITAMNVTAVLNDHGYRVITAHTGEEAVEISHGGGEISLVLMDIDLGAGMDGPEAAQAILAERMVPIVFLTAHSEREMVDKVRGITRYGYVIKNSGDFVLTSSIEMAFELFDANVKADTESKRIAAILRGLPDMLFVVYRDGHYREIFIPHNMPLPAPTHEIIGKTIHDILGSDEAERHLRVYERCFQTGETQSLEFELELRGERKLYEAHITIYDERSILAIVRDITERKKSDEQIHESESKYRQLFHNAPAGIYEVDFATRRFTKVNSLICEYTGYPEEELLTMNPLDILTEESKAQFLSRVEAMLSGQPVSKEIEYQIKEKNGHTRWVILNNEFIRKDGQITGAAVVAHDISERKKAEESIHALLAEKELLLQEVHHRIKNNMTMVKSLLSLQSRAVKNPEASAILNDAAGRIQSIEMLYDKLYRTEGFRDLNMNDFIQSLVEEIFNAVPDRAQITKRIDVADIVISSKKLLPLGIIIYELITNSRRHAFGDSGGAISLTASKNSNTITVRYSDNGIGLADDITIDSTTGFGMRLVAMMVKQIRGSVTIGRRNGTEFVIEFEAQ